MMHRALSQEQLPPFDELMISWNGSRPLKGEFQIYVRLQVGEWLPWLLYSSWGSEGQSSFNSTNPPVKVYQDAVQLLDGKKATGFQIKVVPESECRFHVYTNGERLVPEPISYTKSIYLPVQGLSQMTLNHPRHRDLCSPTSTTAVVRYLLKHSDLDPVEFANRVWDGKFDIFGNWVLNVAEASNKLGPSWDAWVERLPGFDPIYQSLLEGVPVIVSVRGPLAGSARPYAKGHLLAVIGFDPERSQVICMDPAFPTDEETHVRYGLADFLQAWERRGRIAYRFKSRHH